ncbi:hypothetical protein QYM36_004836 [Artemia franciscana]|uniref:Reverse transcriptase domain-containing protein n=1 Tax=Artemia franciscana TaxID=6661 RepID=A0AA88I073_ARTSF|nr:hypothetical protein QYM36_004836 [Artemia franciscana]
MNCYQADVLCLSETRLNGVSEETMPVRDSDNSYLFLSSGAHDGSGDHGVRFMIGRRAQKALLAWDPVNPRIARLKLKEDYSTFLSLLNPRKPLANHVEDGMPVEFLELLKAYYEHCRSIVRVLDGEAEPFNVESSAKQGCTLCPVLFNYCIDWILKRTFSSFDGVVMGSGINVSDLDNTDDIDTLAADPATAQAMLNKTAHFSQLLGMKINTAKTKVMDLNIQLDYHLVLYRQELERN